MSGGTLILYHFTAVRFLKSIQKQGLTRGAIPKSLFPPEVIVGYQWLTENCSFDQEWEKPSGRLAYRRNEARLKIAIPTQMEHNLIPMRRVRELTPDLFDDLVMFGDPENHWVYKGKIFPAWILNITINPTT